MCHPVSMHATREWSVEEVVGFWEKGTLRAIAQCLTTDSVAQRTGRVTKVVLHTTKTSLMCAILTCFIKKTQSIAHTSDARTITDP